MNADLQKINSLVTAIKMAEKEFEKQEVKANEAKKKADDLQKQKDEFTAKIKELEAELTAPLEDDEIKALTAELEGLEKSAEGKTEEKTLIADIDNLEKKIKELERESKGLSEDIEAIKSGKYNFKYAEYELLDNPEENLKKREELAKKVKVERDANGRLTVKTIQQLIDGCLEYFKPKFIVLANRERKERRRYIDNTKKWVEVSLSLFDEIDRTTDESQKEFLSMVNVDFNDFNTEVENYCKEQNYQIAVLMSMIPQKMKSMMTSGKKLTKAKVRDVMRYQIELVMSELPQLIPNLPMPNPNDPNFNPEKIALLVNNRVNDLMWKKFEVEEEDFVEAMKNPSIANDMEINQLAMQMEMMMMSMGGMGGGMGGMPPMGGMPDMGGMGGMGGMPPMGGMGGFPGMF